MYVHMNQFCRGSLTFMFPLPSSLGPAELVAACAWLWERGKEINSYENKSENQQQLGIENGNHSTVSATLLQ